MPWARHARSSDLVWITAKKIAVRHAATMDEFRLVAAHCGFDSSIILRHNWQISDDVPECRPGAKLNAPKKQI